MKLKQFIVLLLIHSLLFSCAQIVPLTGGEKDIEPPKEIESVPKNGSINFSEKVITIEFNEFIKLTNLSSQLIVSPLMENSPEIIVKGKKLLIKIDSELKENITYSINFGNAISDITEGNIFPNYKYVFSTGAYIDSLEYSGTTIDAFDLSEMKSIYVLLYDQFEDSIPLKQRPNYIALSDEKGHFSITNIAQGQYKLFALNDINNNYLFDLPTEIIGFKSETVKIDSSSKENIILLFKEDRELQYLTKAENKVYGKVDLFFNLPTKNLSVSPIGINFDQKWYFEEKNKAGDSLTLWLTTTEGLKNLELLISDGSDFMDTSEIKLIPFDEFKDSSLQITTNVTGNFDLNKKVVITSKRPIIEKLVSTIKLFEDSLEVQYDFEEAKSSIRKFIIEYNFKENKNYQLLIPYGAFTDILNLKNDTLKMDFKTKQESDYGTINLSIVPSYSENNIVQLFKGKKLIKEVHSKGAEKIDYQYLLPGDYSLKLIIDRNNDKKWTTGNYLNGTHPEKVIYYEKEIKIRANWENEIIWTINE